MISPGRDFQAEIDRSLAAADAVLAMIGPGWLTAATVTGEPRLYQAGDFVRTELSRALKLNLTVVPVLVGGATMPSVDDLPPDLSDLTRRQAVVVRDEAFHADVDRLLKLLRGEPERRAGWISRRRPALAAAAALVLVAAGGLTWWVRAQPSAGSAGSSAPTGCPSTGSGTWTDIALAAHPTGTVPYASRRDTHVYRQRREVETRTAWAMADRGEHPDGERCEDQRIARVGEVPLHPPGSAGLRRLLFRFACARPGTRHHHRRPGRLQRHLPPRRRDQHCSSVFGRWPARTPIHRRHHASFLRGQQHMTPLVGQSRTLARTVGL